MSKLIASTWHLTQPVRLSRISLEEVRRKFNDFSETGQTLDNMVDTGLYAKGTVL